MIDLITPVILTYNEEPNIARTLAALVWAREIVVVDSNSTDKTREIVAGFPNTRLFQRVFDTHANHWNFAIGETGISSDWVLALDADYLVPAASVEEMRRLEPDQGVTGYTVAFRYCVNGKPLRGALYPPVTVLFRLEKAHYVQDGHTQRLQVEGTTRMLSCRFDHDDRKPLSHWLTSQDRYMRLESAKIETALWVDLSVSDRVRRLPLVAPFAVFTNCYIVRRGFLDGRVGLYYALQRMLAEILLALRILEHRMLHADVPPAGSLASSPRKDAIDPL